ncbi:MAG: thioredoxin family protein [Planctomycetaceae bacterium]|nr:thioredoxin family protein [Planctomycetaceae bacterium]
MNLHQTLTDVRLAVVSALFVTLTTIPLLGDDFNFLIGEKVGQQEQAEADVKAALSETDDSGVVLLQVRLTVPPGANTYSQDPSFAKPTKITVTTPAGLTPLGEGFVPDHPPKVAFDANFDKDVEKFTGSVTFTRRFLLPQGVDVKSAKLEGVVSFLMCNDETCLPQKISFAARVGDALLPLVEKPAPAGAPSIIDLAGPSDLPAPSDIPAPTDMPAPPEDAPPPMVKDGVDVAEAYQLTPMRGEDADPISLTFWYTRVWESKASDASTVTLNIRMQLDEGWRTYALEPAGEDQIEVPTALTLGELSGMKPVGEWRSSPAPELHKTEVGTSSAHEHVVTWSHDFEVTDGEAIGLQGSIRYQLCKELCLRPLTIAFSLGKLQQSEDTARAVLLAALPDPDSDVPNLATDSFEVEGQVTSADSGLWWILAIAFFGGIMLNVMPCVLPVLAIKILSFVQQAGESRQRILLLNVFYTIGVLFVFMILAGLSVVGNMAFGDLFQDWYFNMAMILIVFAMGLSLLGVFELPISGILPSASSHKEGLGGAFWTGIIATLLATPCTAGVMVTPLAFLRDQPPSMSFLVFGLMGLGMAFPYLLAGLFPKIVRLIPKPGEWMVKFKQICGFVLLGTVIFLMDSLDDKEILGTCVVLLGVGLGLWMLTNLVDQNSSFTAKVRNALLTIVVCGPVIAWGVIPKMEIESVPFSEARFNELRQQGKPILIDFTADWCAICKKNEFEAINTRETQSFLREHDIEFMVADFTKEDPTIRKWLNKFEQQSVPLTVIVPPDNKPFILISGGYSKALLLEKLRKAVGDTPKQTAQNPSTNAAPAL